MVRATKKDAPGMGECHAQLKKQVSLTECVFNKTFGCAAGRPGVMWISFGCRGLFSLSNAAGQTTQIECGLTLGPKHRLCSAGGEAELSERLRNTTASIAQRSMCHQTLSTRYSTIRPRHPGGGQNSVQEAVSWRRAACPWEEMRHSGYYWHFEEADDALDYAARHACPQLSSSLRRLDGHRFLFVGDSLTRQWTQSLLCRLHQSLNVVSDGIVWTHPPNKRWGTCPEYPGEQQPLRFCQMSEGCVRFERDIVVCYKLNHLCVAEVAQEMLWDWVGNMTHLYGAGERFVVTLSHGMHAECSENSFATMHSNATSSMARMLRASSANAMGARLSPSKLLLVYKEMEATHFEAESGLYSKISPSLRPKCVPVAPGDPLPPLRELELRVGLPAMRKLGARVIETFDDDQRHGALLHVQRAKVASRNQAVDCLHWMMPGVPDTWTEKLLKVIDQ